MCLSNCSCCDTHEQVVVRNSETEERREANEPV